ncbi:NEQ408 [Nanoarchaeum equitans Kin4-M]|uniref:NEQ408 n=1 Tax=Nanoarchaeum equitans (strain Kin4-M) TaxID=228908 RepID=Q74ME6_NANEQ|nr:NEQ408 [Nanoarchaeum equitans Kin4-M]
MIKAQVFYDALGAPKENVVSFLKDLVERIKQYEGAKVIDYKILEPEPQGNNLYSSVAILIMEFEDLFRVFQFVLDYPPATIEILYPEGPDQLLRDIEKELSKCVDKEKVNQLRKEIKALKSLIPTKATLNLILNDLATKQHQMGLLIKELQARLQLQQ